MIAPAASGSRSGTDFWQRQAALKGVVEVAGLRLISISYPLDPTANGRISTANVIADGCRPSRIDSTRPAQRFVGSWRERRAWECPLLA